MDLLRQLDALVVMQSTNYRNIYHFLGEESFFVVQRKKDRGKGGTQEEEGTHKKRK